MLAKRIEALHQVPGLSEEAQILALSLQRLAIHPLQFRLVVERFQMADAAAAEDLHNALRAGREVLWRAG
jgi:hypothetical protein